MKLVSRIGFYTITVSKTQITYSGWTGVEYIFIDPTKGAGAYMISEGLMEAATSKPLPLQELDALYNRVCLTKRELVVGIAISYLFTPYATGWKDPPFFDCSGFVGWVYMQVGYPQLYNGNFGISAVTQYTKTKHTDYPLIGDLVFYSHTNDPKKIHHVGITLPVNMMIDAPNSASFVRIENLWSEYHFLDI